MDGDWREERNPTLGEVEAIDGETQKLGFGEFAWYTYVEILTYKPQYVEFLTEDGNRGHIDWAEFPDRVMRKDVGNTVGDVDGEVE